MPPTASNPCSRCIRWTGRPWGYVGGLGQQPQHFGPFGLASRTPLRGLWLCGDHTETVPTRKGHTRLDEIQQDRIELPEHRGGKPLAGLRKRLRGHLAEASPTNMLCLTAFPTPHDRMVRDGYCLRRPSRPRHPFSDNKVASRGSQMTRRAFGMPCSWPSDGVSTPPAGKPLGPGPSGGHEKHPGLAATRLTFVVTSGVFTGGM